MERAPETAQLVATRPGIFLVGTSRTMLGLRPKTIEQELRATGMADPWVANVSMDRMTTVGELQHYLKEIHPLVAQQGASGVVAFEVRGEGLNDSYLTDAEEEWLARQSFEPLEPGPGSAAPPRVAPYAGPLSTLRALRWGAAARAALGGLALARSREILAPELERLLGLGAAPAAAPHGSGGPASTSGAPV